jgi:cysteinyl-tRNA synthetase
MHTNMLTINGQKMSKSLGNSFLPRELFSGIHALLTKGYSPMVVRFFMLQTHYRSTLDFSNDALNAAETAFNRLQDAYKTLRTLKASEKSTENIGALQKACYDAMNDDLNTSVLMAQLFDAARIINSTNDGKSTLTQADIELLNVIFKDFLFDICGVRFDEDAGESSKVLHNVVDVLLEMRAKAKADKNFQLSDELRNKLVMAGVKIKDGKEGSTWSI